VAGTAEPPAELARLVTEVRHGGVQEQPAIAWPRRRWIGTFPELADHFEALPARLDRKGVRAACVGADAGRDDARRGFVTVMAWGFGNVGYGPWRTRRILEARRADERLHHVARVLASDGAVAAYREMGSTSRLPWLGATFGTKYLFFCRQARKPAPRALILDRLVSAWIADHTGIRLNPATWQVNTYQRYLDLMGRWADALGVRTDVIEWCIVTDRSREVGNQWGR
jgi:hypothetical protein